jgi:hypothetical protein
MPTGAPPFHDRPNLIPLEYKTGHRRTFTWVQMPPPLPRAATGNRTHGSTPPLAPHPISAPHIRHNPLPTLTCGDALPSIENLSISREGLRFTSRRLRAFPDKGFVQKREARQGRRSRRQRCQPPVVSSPLASAAASGGACATAATRGDRCRLSCGRTIIATSTPALATRACNTAHARRERGCSRAHKKGVTRHRDSLSIHS